MNNCRSLFPLLLATLLLNASCSTVNQPKAPVATKLQEETTTTVAHPPVVNKKSQLDLLIDQLTAQAQESRRSRQAKFKDVIVEVTPMWSLNYQGEVHIRVHDNSGKVIRDEYR